MDGLHDNSPSVDAFCVSKSVRAPVRADAVAASDPACPPPITITSYDLEDGDDDEVEDDNSDVDEEKGCVNLHAWVLFCCSDGLILLHALLKVEVMADVLDLDEKE